MLDVLLVDDEEIILTGLTKVFPWAKYDCRVVDTARDGREGLKLIRQLRPQILLTDIRMPNMDGLSMIAAVESEFPGLQVTVLTAFRDFDYAQTAIRLGVCRYLLKPSRMEELHEAVGFMAARAKTEARTEDASDDPGESAAGSFVAEAALRYIDDHYAEHLTLGEVADHVYVSQWHLSKLINRCARQSFFDLLNARRVRAAQELLANPAYRVGDVALAVGYADVTHFSRIFRKVTGRTPGEFRNSL